MHAELNGTSTPLEGVDPHTNALDWLRAQGFTGAKEGCAEGECGACSVLVRKPSPDGTPGSAWVAINSCLVPALSLDGQDVVTAEGLGSPDALHPVQREMAVRGGSQCGYCTPGFVCSMAAEFYRRDRHAGCSSDDAEHGPNGFDLHALSGNLCRCTGYRPIKDAAYALGTPDSQDHLADRREDPAPPAVHTRTRRDDVEFIRPQSLDEAVRLLAESPETQLVAGSTDWGVGVNLLRTRARRLVALDRLPELRVFDVSDEHATIGAALSLTEIEQQLHGRIPLLSKLFPQFASRLIRNGATLGGNLGTGSPIGDSPPVLLALDAAAVLTGPSGERTVRLDQYFTGYRQSVRHPDEIITAVRIPLPAAPLTAFHKIAKRRFDDISSVAVAIALDAEDGVITRAGIGLGGVAATPLRATAVEEMLVGSPLTAATFAAAADVLAAEGTPMSDHRASAAYRAAMLRTSLPRFFADLNGDAS